MYIYVHKCELHIKFKPTILVIKFRNFTMLYYKSDSPQVQQNLMSTITKLVHQLPHELPHEQLKTQDLTKLGSIRTISNLGGNTAYCPLSFPEL